MIYSQAGLAIGLDPSGVKNIEDDWRFFIRQEEPLDLKQLAATNKSYAKLFPALRTVAIRVLLLPVSTAVVERLFSSMNRVITIDRTKLTNDNLDDTMFISIEGQAIPNSRTQTTPEYNSYATFINNVYKRWLSLGERRIYH